MTNHNKLVLDISILLGELKKLYNFNEVIIFKALSYTDTRILLSFRKHVRDVLDGKESFNRDSVEMFCLN